MLSVRDAGRQDHRVRIERSAVREAHRARRAVDLQPDDVAGRDEFGAETYGLPARPLGELRARDAVGKAEVILDPRTLASLAAGGGALDEDGAQPFRRAVHRSAEAGRAAADDDQV